MTRSTSCESRWASNKDDRVSDLRRLLAAWHGGDAETCATDLGTLAEYGLGFDYVAPGTFDDQKEGYWRFQLSWGGPSDEFRFYAGGCGEQQPYRIAYASLNWFDGHEKALAGDDLEVMEQVWTFFRDTGMTTTEYHRAMRTADNRD